MDLKSGISEIIGIKADDIPASIEYRIIESIKEAGYERQLIEYNSNGDTVRIKTNTRGMQTLLLNKLVHHMQNMALIINYVIRDIMVDMD